MSNNGPRYQAREPNGEPRHNCCYEAEVVDTAVCGTDWDRLVCECKTIEAAKEIAAALNRSAML